jgi:LmbE family N-acetylglucosaminyl deacetylase
MKKTLLVLAPHTDDGEFGCGGTISKYLRDGWRVVYIAFSAAEQSVLPHLPHDILRIEVKCATKVLGIKPLDCIVLDFEVRKFPEQRQAILEEMVKLNREFQPNLVLLPSPNDTHQDHSVIAHEGFRAFKRTSLLGYEVPWNNLDFRTTCFVHLNQEDVDKKVAALLCYESQAHRVYASENVVRSQAVFRGTQIGTKYAEAFEVLRWITS